MASFDDEKSVSLEPCTSEGGKYMP